MDDADRKADTQDKKPDENAAYSKTDSLVNSIHKRDQLFKDCGKLNRDLASFIGILPELIENFQKFNMKGSQNKTK